MTDVGVLRILWTGFSGAPGVSTFGLALPDESTLGDAVADLSLATAGMMGYLPAGVTLTVSGQVDVFEAETGVLQSELSATDGTPRVGTGAGAMIAASGACINWTTGTISNGRRIRGRTFIVPMDEDAFDANGTLSAGGLGAVDAMRTGFLNYNATAATNRLAVWSRPREATETTASRVGSLGIITGGSIPDKQVVLRSRRD